MNACETRPSASNLVNKQINRRCTKAKEEWLKMECQEVECQVSNPKETFHKIKKIAGKRSTLASNCIKTADGMVLQESKDMAQRWKEYLQELFHDEQEQEVIPPRQLKLDPEFLKMMFIWP